MISLAKFPTITYFPELLNKSLVRRSWFNRTPKLNAAHLAIPMPSKMLPLKTEPCKIFHDTHLQTVKGTCKTRNTKFCIEAERRSSFFRTSEFWESPRWDIFRLVYRFLDRSYRSCYGAIAGEGEAKGGGNCCEIKREKGRSLKRIAIERWNEKKIISRYISRANYSDTDLPLLTSITLKEDKAFEEFIFSRDRISIQFLRFIYRIKVKW